MHATVRTGLVIAASALLAWLPAPLPFAVADEPGASGESGEKASDTEAEIRAL